MIKDFDSFNEEFLGVDLKKIKHAAYEFHKTKKCRELISSIDSSLLDKAVSELKTLKQRWGSLDNLGNKLISKVENKNEGVVSTVVLTAFGIHAFLKLIIAFKKGGFSIPKYLVSLFGTGKHNYEELFFLKNLIITGAFIIFLIAYIAGSTNKCNDLYKIESGAAINLEYTWSGIHDYIVTDSFGKKYHFKRISSNNYVVLYKGKKIGMYGNNVYDLNGKEVITKLPEGTYACIKYDLEKILTGKSDTKSLKEIDIRQKEIAKLNKEIDSLYVKTFENIDLAKKLFKDSKLDYDSDKYFSLLKTDLEKNNNIGYLGLFAKLYINFLKHNFDQARGIAILQQLYHRILLYKDNINQLRDNEGNLINLVDFNTYEEIDDALVRLDSWKKINSFIKRLPPTQKKIIWENGWFKGDLKNSAQYLSDSILKISSDSVKLKTFLSKVSSIKTQEGFIDNFSRINQEVPWDFNYWLNKLNRSRNVYVTWSSKEDKQILCAVSSYKALKKIAYMTNWCIVRSRSYFRSYCVEQGLQFVLYDFNRSLSSDNSVTGITVRHNGIIYEAHSKSDGTANIPSKFIQREAEDYYRYHGNRIMKPEYIKINLVKAALKFDKLFLRKLNEFLSKQLNRNKYVSKFIDFYDENQQYK